MNPSKSPGRAVAEKSDLEHIRNMQGELPPSPDDLGRLLDELLNGLPGWRLDRICENTSGNWYVGFENRNSTEHLQRYHVAAEEPTLAMAFRKAAAKAIEKSIEIARQSLQSKTIPAQVEV